MVPINVVLTGRTPLLCGRPASDPTAPSLSPAAQAAMRLYRDGAGAPMMPGLNVYRAIAGGLRALHRLPAEVMHGIGIQETAIPIAAPRPWTVDTRPVHTSRPGERTLCHRPRFETWRLAFTLLVDPEVIPLADAHHLLVVTGERVGIGDYRPERGGPFGRFVVTAWDVVSAGLAAAEAR